MMATPKQQTCYVNVPETVSPQAQKFLRTLSDPALMPCEEQSWPCELSIDYATFLQQSFLHLLPGLSRKVQTNEHGQ